MIKYVERNVSIYIDYINLGDIPSNKKYNKLSQKYRMSSYRVRQIIKVIKRHKTIEGYIEAIKEEANLFRIAHPSHENRLIASKRRKEEKYNAQ